MVHKNGKYLVSHFVTIFLVFQRKMLHLIVFLHYFFCFVTNKKITKQRRMMKFFNESMIDHRAIKMSSTNEAKMRCNDMELRIIFLSINSYYLICKIKLRINIRMMKNMINL